MLQPHSIAVPATKRQSIFKIQKIIALRNRKSQQFTTLSKKNHLRKHRELHLEKIKNQISDLIYQQYQTQARLNSLRQINNSSELLSDLEQFNSYKNTRYGCHSLSKKRTQTKDSIQINSSKFENKKMLGLSGQILSGEKKQVKYRRQVNKSKQKHKKILPHIKLKNKAKFTTYGLFDGKFQPWRGGLNQDFQGF